MVDISTHAPRTGSDHCWAPAFRPSYHFNPRSPHGERLHDRTLSAVAIAISTHAPRTGSDTPAIIAPPAEDISTHAPRTGSDNGE